ncbi:MAG: glutamate--tRNA ligase [Armatimonadota bacterium]
MSDQVRVRFAPSPTGGLHVGGVRTALFNWLFARKHGGRFILRIEDTDEERSTLESLQAILEGFRWVGLVWDEGPDVGGPYEPYIQSQRTHIYDTYFEKLLADGNAYPCFCTPEELKQRRDAMARSGLAPKYDGKCRNLSDEQRARFRAEGRPSCLRFRMPQSGRTEFDDLVYGHMQFENVGLDDFVVRKTSGFPTYNFACVVDDALMQISHVIRGEQHLSNTPRQVRLLAALGLTPPTYVHVSHVLAPDGTKLSKRHGATDIDEFRRAGFLPEALLNFLALLGWSTGDEQELLSAEELTRRFSLERVSRSGAVFDVEKLRWMNGQYINSVSLTRLAEAAIPFLQERGLLEAELSDDRRAYVERVLELMRERLRTLEDLVTLAGFFFVEDVCYDEKAIEKWLSLEWVPDVLEQTAERLQALADFSADCIEPAIRGLAGDLGRKAAEIIHPTRAAVTGLTLGPGLFELLAVLGQDRVVARLRRAAELARSGRLAKAVP